MKTYFSKALAALFVVSMLVVPGFAQTFRGALSGTVVDVTGAVIADATVQLTNTGTALTQTTKSNKAGEFNFPELPVGAYTLTVSFSGFTTNKIDNINIEVSKVLNLPVTLSLGSESTVVDVSANAVEADTASSALVAVISSTSVADMPMNGRNFTQMTHFSPGAAANSNSINGSRTASINFQMDGADNVDSWNGIVASNQGGIASVAGGLIPIEAIDQFSMQSGGEADQGRNAGANSNMVLKAGTNHIHGDVFYFDRNEFFAAISPVAPVGARKTLIRNHQGGFTLGGPIWKDHTFLFLAGEIQIAKANSAISDTVLSNSWISDGEAFLAKYGITSANSLSLNLYNLLWPSYTQGLAATTNNYLAAGTSNYNSFNGLIKLDHHFSDKQYVSAHYLGTTGKQTAPTGSALAWYFQTAPMHIHNIAITHSYAFNGHLLNQVTAAANYFLQTFNDADQNFNPGTVAGLSLGLGTGNIIASGAPTIAFGGGTSCSIGATFDCSGATQPSGRTDVTGQITDNLHWTIGRHSLKLGGEFRHTNVNQLYFSSVRGSFGFDGTRGPWSGNTATDKANCASIPSPQVTSSGACNTNILSLADFLVGESSASSGAKLLQGWAQRVWLMNTEDGWASDGFQATKKLYLSFGARYTIPGVIQAEKNDVYSFNPGATPGFQLGTYPEYYKGIAPRVGFAYSPFDNSKTVIRGAWGIFYDFPAMSNWVVGTTTNGGANYIQNNPAGPDAAAIFTRSNMTWAYGVNPFVGAAAPTVGAYGVNQNFRMPYAEVFSFGVEQQLSKSTLFTLGYVGSEGRRLLVLYDLNQPMANGTSTQGPRPYPQLSYPNENATYAGNALLGINQLNFGASSNFNSLQVTVKQAMWKGIQATANYTWGRSMDDVSSSTTPMNSYNIHQDYGPSTFDQRNLLNGFVYYNVPQIGHFAPKLTKGFQLNAIYTYSSGNPVSPVFSSDISKTTELHDRPNIVAGTNPYVSNPTTPFTNTATGRTYRWLSNANGTFTTPAAGMYGNEQRDAYYGPNFRDIDFSLFKHTPITERVDSEFRVEIFNIINFNNFANPGVSNPVTSSTFGVITQTRNGSSAPGIGLGEPFNIQFALKISF